MATAQTQTRYTFADEPTMPERRGLFDMAVDVFGADDPVIGANPTRVAIQDALDQAQTFSYTDAEGKMHQGSIEDTLEDATRDQRVRADDFLASGRGFEDLQAALRGASDFDAQATYFGYLLQSLVGYQMDVEGSNGAAAAVTDVASQLIRGKQSMAKHVDAILKTRRDEPSLESQQRDQLIDAVGRVSTKLREEVAARASDEKLLTSLQDVRMVDADGNWKVDSFQEGGFFRDAESDTTMLPAHGVNKMLQPAEGSTGNSREDWGVALPLEAKAFPGVLHAPSGGEKEEGETATQQAVRVLRFLSGMPEDEGSTRTRRKTEPGLIARLARERTIYGRSLALVGKAAQDQYNVTRDMLQRMAVELNRTMATHYTETATNDAVYLGARRPEGGWTETARRVIANAAVGTDDLLRPTGELEGPSDTSHEQINRAAVQIYSVLLKTNADRDAVYQSSVGTIHKVRTKMMQLFNDAAVGSFAKDDTQRKLQQDGFATMGWYSHNPAQWNELLGVDAASTEDIRTIEYSTLALLPNVKEAKVLGVLPTPELFDLLVKAPMEGIASTVPVLYREVSDINALAKEWVEGIEDARRTGYDNVGKIAGIRERVEKTGSVQAKSVPNSVAWNQPPDKGNLQIEYRIITKDRTVSDVMSEAVQIRNVVAWTKNPAHKNARALLPLARKYVAYLEGWISNLSHLVETCVESRGEIWAPEKGPGSTEAVVHDEGAAARLAMARVKKLVTEFSANSVDRYIDVMVGKDKLGTGFSEKIRRNKGITRTRVVGSIVLDVGWEEVETIDDAVSKIWNALVQPRIEDHAKWVDAYVLQSTTLGETAAQRDDCSKALQSCENTREKLSLEMVKKSAKVEGLAESNKQYVSRNKDLVGRLKASEKKKNDIEKERDAARAEAAKKEADVMEFRKKLIFEAEKYRESLFEKWHKEWATLQTKYDLASKDKAVAQKLFNLDIEMATRHLKAEREAATQYMIEGDPVTMANLRAEIDTLRQANEEYKTQSNAQIAFVASVNLYVNQTWEFLRVVDKNAETTLTDGRAELVKLDPSESASRRKQIQDLENARRAFHSALPKLEGDGALQDKLNRWAAKQTQKRGAAPSLSSTAAGVFQLILSECRLAEQRMSELQTTIMGLKAQVERLSQEKESAVPKEHVVAVREKLDKANAIITLGIEVIFNEYIQQIRTMNVQGEKAKAFVGSIGDALDEFKKSRHRANDVFPVEKISEIMMGRVPIVQWKYIGKNAKLDSSYQLEIVDSTNYEAMRVLFEYAVNLTIGDVIAMRNLVEDATNRLAAREAALVNNATALAEATASLAEVQEQNNSLTAHVAEIEVALDHLTTTNARLTKLLKESAAALGSAATATKKIGAAELPGNIAELKRTYKDRIEALAGQVKAEQQNAVFAINRSAEECKQRLAVREQEYKDSIKKLEAESKRQIAQLNAIHKKALELQRALAAESGKKTAESKKEAERLKGQIERTVTKMRGVEALAAKKVAEAARKQEVATASKKIAEEELRAKERLERKKKTLDVQLQAIEDKERRLREEHAEQQRAESEKLRRKRQEGIITQEFEKLAQDYNDQINTYYESFIEADTARMQCEAELEYLKEEIPDMEDVLAPIADQLSGIAATYSELVMLWESARYSEIFAYGVEKGFILATPDRIPGPVLDRMDLDENGTPKLTGPNVSTAFAFFNEFVTATLANSGTVAVVWTETKTALDESDLEVAVLEIGLSEPVVRPPPPRPLPPSTTPKEKRGTTGPPPSVSRGRKKRRGRSGQPETTAEAKMPPPLEPPLQTTETALSPPLLPQKPSLPPSSTDEEEEEAVGGNEPQQIVVGADANKDRRDADSQSSSWALFL